MARGPAHRKGEGDASLEQWAAGRRRDLLDIALGQPLSVEFESVAAAAGSSPRAASA